MSKIIKIRKGLDISLEGKAEKVLSKTAAVGSYAVKPGDFHQVVPKLAVKEGDAVLAGSPLFVDKYRPEVRYVSPVSGTVTALVRGDKRLLQAVVVTPDEEQTYVQHAVPDVATATRDEIIALMLASGTWAFLRQRPYGIAANPTDRPKAIFVSGFDTAPLAPDMDYVLTGEGEAFQKGIDVLQKITDKVYLGVNDQPPAVSVFRKVKGVERNVFTGPHPAGNVGVQIHHIWRLLTRAKRCGLLIRSMSLHWDGYSSRAFTMYQEW